MFCYLLQYFDKYLHEHISCIRASNNGVEAVSFVIIRLDTWVFLYFLLEWNLVHFNFIFLLDISLLFT